MENNELYEYELVAMFADTISQSRYSSTTRKILDKVNNNYYNMNEISTTVAEAFYNEFKRFSIAELRDLQAQNHILARDGKFIDEDGNSIEYNKVILEVLSPKNIENQVSRFLGSNFGIEVEEIYKSNLQAQKDFALEIYTNYFIKTEQEPSFEAIKSKSIYSIYKEVEDLMPEYTKFNTPYQTIDDKYGVPVFELSGKNVKAEFSTGVEVKHLLTDKEFLNIIKQHIEDPVYENEQEYVWDRLAENKSSSHIKSTRKSRI